MKHLYLAILTVFALMASMATYAEKVYKWQDDDGSWHYSEKPPLEIKAETLKIKVSQPSPQSNENGSDKGQTESDTAGAPMEQPLKKSPEIIAAEEARKKQECERARKNLEALTNRPRIRYMDKEKGEERYLTPDEHTEWSKKSKEDVQKYCQ